MSDEQHEMANDFFADTEGIVNDAMPTNAESESITDSPVSQPNNQNTVNPNKPNNPAPVAPGSEAVPGQGKTAIDTDNPESMLFTTDEKGNTNFNVNKAMEFAKPDTKVFEGVADPLAEANKAQLPKQPEIPEWERRVNQRKEAESAMVQNLTLYETYLREAVKAGYSGPAAFDYAKAKISEVVRTQMERTREEESAQREVEWENKMRDREEAIQQTSRAKTNIAAVDRELGGNFEKLTIGYAKDGKYVPGIASNDVNTLFTLMNPDAMKNPATLKQTYESWWTKITANEQTCRYVANIARLRLLEKSIPHLLQAQRSASGAQTARLNEGKGKSPSTIQQSPAAGNEPDSFDSWLNAPPGNKVDVIG